MALIFRTYECPDCSGRFELMQQSEEAAPRFCLHCGADFGEDEDARPGAVPGTHSIGGSSAARAVDNTYALAEQMGQDAYERTGNPNLKITNMRDNMREGDVAAMPSVTPANNGLLREAHELGLSPGWHSAGSIGVGPTPPPPEYATGVKALGALQGTGGQTHADMLRAMQKAGQLNRDS